MGEDDRRRPFGEPADVDKPWQAPDDDDESELGDFVFPDESDEDFVFSDGSDESDEGDRTGNPRNTPSTTDTAGTTDSTVDRQSKNRDVHSPNKRHTSQTNTRRTDSGSPRSRPTDVTDATRSRSHRDQFSDSNSSTTDSTDSRRSNDSTRSHPQERSQNRSSPHEHSQNRSETSSEEQTARNDAQSNWSTGGDVPWKRDSPTSSSSSDTDDQSSTGSDSTAQSTGSIGTSSTADSTATGTESQSGSTHDSPAPPATTTQTKSDGGTLTSENTEISKPAPVDDDALVPSGPTEDQEMPLSDHIEEMVRRVLVVILVMSIVSIIAFPFADQLINYIWYSILDPTTSSSKIVRPRVYHPLALVLARLKVATLAGFVVALPVFVYETYLFMRPGLYPRERRYYIAAIPTSLVLAALGVAFAFLVVLPLIFIYFMGYSQGAAEIAFGLSDTFGLMLLLIGFFALIFQIPLFIMLAVMMGVTSRKWLTERRLYFWGGFLGLAFITNPDPTGMAPIIVAGSMVVLFEATLLLLKWTE